MTLNAVTMMKNFNVTNNHFVGINLSELFDKALLKSTDQVCPNLINVANGHKLTFSTQKIA